jgi:restriction system protein
VAVPDYETMMLPLLRATDDGRIHQIRDLVLAVADALAVPLVDRSAETRGGGQTQLDSRARWAKVYLVRAGLLESAGHGTVSITKAGREALSEDPARIDVSFLKRYAEFRDFRHRAARTLRTT